MNVENLREVINTMDTLFESIVHEIKRYSAITIKITEHIGNLERHLSQAINEANIVKELTIKGTKQ